MGEYPEHEKLKAIREDSQTIGEFLDFGRWILCEQVPANAEFHAHFRPVDSIQAVLAEYFEIDQDKIDVEKRSMLEELRSS